uniref:Predicted protein n=1 Tax=Hordeum vulgare subsp. vulgare TaxID=112509 RepID=F2EIF1_HORVV|nr:predicted protein [Hordeum vulgare subsp. vulgare]
MNALLLHFTRANQRGEERMRRLCAQAVVGEPFCICGCVR